jgi:hypothetical protein
MILLQMNSQTSRAGSDKLAKIASHGLDLRLFGLDVLDVLEGLDVLDVLAVLEGL